MCECARSEASGLKLVIEAFPSFAIPVRILNLGNRVAFYVDCYWKCYAAAGSTLL